MKILTVHIKNLNSLRIQRKIDFTASPLGDVGLFAIVGDTGAGKTTILDAITLGLYGRVHRNKKEEEVMSHGAVESFAEVEFLAKSEQYKTRWQIRRAYNKIEGAIQASQQELSVWNEKEQRYDILTTRKRDFAEQVENITGLDYERFQRSVMLSQGDFAAFLKANELQRSELLERITGREIYSQLSIAAFERNKLEKSKLEDLQKEFAALQILLPEEISEIETQLAETKKEGKQAKKTLDQTQRSIQWLQQLANLQKQEEVLRQQLQAIAEKKKIAQPDLDRLALHQKTIPLQADLTKFEIAQETNAQLQIELQELQTRETTLVETETKKRAIFGQQKSDFVALKKQVTTDEKLFKKVEKIDIEIDNKNAPLKTQIIDLEQLSKEKDRTNIEEKSLTEEILNLKKSTQELTDALTKQQHLATLEVELPQIRTLRSELREWYGSKHQAQQKIEDLKILHKEAQAEFTSLDEQLAEAKENLIEAKTTFKSIAPDYFVDSRASLLHQYQQKIANLNTERYEIDRYCELLEAYDKEISLFTLEQDSQENLQRQLDILDQALLSSLDSLAESEAELEYRRSIFEQEKLKVNYTKDRQNLQEGEQCPLCFSTKHPFRHHHFEIYVDRTQRDYKRAKDIHDLVAQNHQKVARQQMDLSNKLRRQIQGVDLLELDDSVPINPRILELENQIEAFRNKHGHNPIYKYTHAATIRKKTTDIVENHAQSQQKYEQLSQLNQQLDRQEKAVTKLELQKNNALIELKSIESRQETQQSIFAEADLQYQKKINTLNAKLKTFDLVFNVDTAREMFETLETQLTDYQFNKDDLAKQTRQLERAEQSNEQLKVNAIRLEKEYQKLKTQVDKNSAEVARLQVQRKEWFGDKDVDTARISLQEQLERSEQHLSEAKEQLDAAILQLKTTRESLADRQKQWATGQATAKKLEQKLTVQSQEIGFADLTKVLAARLLENVAEQIDQQRELLQRQEIEIKQSYQNCSTELEKQRTQALTELPISTLQLNVEEEQVLYENIQRKIGSLEEKLIENNRRNASASALTQRIQIQQKEANRWATLNSIIGSASGKTFRVFAQGLTLQILTQLANQHLTNLNGRYFIKKSPNSDLELNIVDTYQADNERSMNTLSGGESFLVSLALALGLSDLAGRDTTIRSLFIDEGFGTLDEATLDVAITTLENLQAAGKTIGVISHVKALKERIGTQIRVKKRGNGISEVEVV